MKPDWLVRLFVRSAGLCQEEGQDMIEYALLLGFIAIVTVLVLQNMGQSVSTVFSSAAAAIP